jgi:general secretion pathway protein F
LRRGDSFPPAFARCFPNVPRYIHRLIEAGDLSGRLAEAIGDAAAELEHEANVRTELRQALVYPAVLVTFGILAVLFIFLVVVPRFAAAFKSRLDQLPLLSSVVINTGMWARQNIVVTFSLLAGFGIAIAWGLSRPQARAFLFDFASRVPVLRHWTADVEVAHWATILARLLENRVPLIQSLELARTPLRRQDIQLVLSRVERDVRAGTALAAALHDADFLAPTALAMIGIGERSGRLPEMMRSLASLYDGIVRNRTKTALLIIEPAAIIVIGAFVGLVAIAIFQAITSINNVPGL